MGFDASTEQAAAGAVDTLDQSQRRQLLPPVHVVCVQSQQLREVRLTIPEEGKDHLCPTPVDWRVELREQSGASHVVTGRAKPREGDRAIVVSLPISPPEGYHTLHATIDSPGGIYEAEQSLIVSPGRCHTLAQCVGDRRVYGLWANLYTVVSRQNWGLGDLTDLRELVRGAAKRGAAFVGVNPLHALRNRGEWIGPYCPVSRLFRNFIYLDVEAVPEFDECRQARARFESPQFQAELARARSARYIDYERVAVLKTQILRLLHGVFLERHLSAREYAQADADGLTQRGRAYAEFITSQGKTLIDYATFLALQPWIDTAQRVWQRFSLPSDHWRDWPVEYRTPDSPEVHTFRNAHRPEVDFQCYVQFEMDRQLAAAADEAQRAGMPIGLYHDLAIGSAGNGSDAWSYPDLFLEGIDVGAPPDPYCQDGQTWGFPPVDPRRLQDRGYDYWIQLLRSTLAHAGMIRIDHVMGLFRQFWVPHGCSGTEGAYVRYPGEDLLGILALESRCHRTVIVGEDLGTVPPELHGILEQWGILSSRVMYFEREHDALNPAAPGFRPARSYSRRALVTATTHDHVPLAGFWTGRDLDIRQEIGLIRTDREREEARAERERTRAALLRRLSEEGLSFDAEAGSAAKLCQAVHAFLARTPSGLLGISLDDLAGEEEPVNIPGQGLKSYPSWSRRMGKSLNDILTDPAVRALLDNVQAILCASSVTPRG